MPTQNGSHWTISYWPTFMQKVFFFFFFFFFFFKVIMCFQMLTVFSCVLFRRKCDSTPLPHIHTHTHPWVLTNIHANCGKFKQSIILCNWDMLRNHSSFTTGCIAEILKFATFIFFNRGVNYQVQITSNISHPNLTNFNITYTLF